MTVDAKSARFKALAERLIENNATQAVLKKPNNSESATPWAQGSPSPASTNVKTVPIEQKQSDIPKTLVGIDHRTYLFSTDAGVTPEKKDLMAFNTTVAGITNDTTWFEILEVSPLSLGAQDLMFTVWVAT